jgi:hypothetical protein
MPCLVVFEAGFEVGDAGLLCISLGVEKQEEPISTRSWQRRRVYRSARPSRLEFQESDVVVVELGRPPEQIHGCTAERLLDRSVQYELSASLARV